MKGKYITTGKLCVLMGVTRQTIRNWILKGDIQAYQVGYHYRIPIEEAARILTKFELPVPEIEKRG